MDDILFISFSYLDLKDIYSCLLVSRRFNEIAGHGSIWKTLLFRNFSDCKYEDDKYKDKYKLNHQLTLLKQKINYKESIYELNDLRALNLHNKQLKELPPTIGHLTNLRRLDLDNNQLKELLPMIGQLANLQILHLHNNQLNELPPTIGTLTNLQYLRLYNNQLKELPSTIGQLTNLRKLYLDNKQLGNKAKQLLPPNVIIYTKN